MPTNGSVPVVSIGIVTIEGRDNALLKLLNHLLICVENYASRCELVICNNGPESYKETIHAIIHQSKIDHACDVSVVQSPENNIAVARNLLFQNTSHNLLAFIDDDEYPSEQWLDQLTYAITAFSADVIAGPVLAVFPENTPKWVLNSDLHNTERRVDGSVIQYTGTGNLLINKSGVPDPKFDTNYGKSGGSDTEFFQRNIDLGMEVRWASNALAYEDVNEDRTNTKFMIRRFMNQGNTYRRIKTLHGKISNQRLFSLRAYAVGLGSIPIAIALLVIQHKSAGLWLKRAFSNLGKVISPSRLLYE